MATKRIPYGITDFRLLSGEDYYYVDKTRFIGEIEKCPNFLFLRRKTSSRNCSASSISVSTRHPSGTAT